MNLPNPLVSACLARPRHPALETADGVLTWSELLGRVRARAATWTGQVEPGHRVALHGPAAAAWVEAFHALGVLGASVAPLPARGTVAELASAMRAVGARWAVSTATGVGLEAVQAAARAAEVPWLRAGESSGGDETERAWPLEEERVVLRTSGTTGEARAIALTTGQLVFSAFGSAVRHGLSPDDRWLACLPLDHVGGLSILVRSAFYGTTVVLHDGFDAARVDAALRGRDGVTLLSLTPSMVEQLLDTRPDFRFDPRVRLALVGGAETSPALEARLRALGAPVALTWGMTEAASQLTSRRLDAPEGLGVGAPLPFTRVEVDVDERLVVSGPTVVGGRHTTSDLGSVEPDGQVWVRGRADDVIVTGGAKVDPAEVEAVLSLHPAVREVAVLGRTDAHWGERLVACVVGDADRVAEVEAHCRAHLSPHKCPKAWIWREALPRNTLGKLDRRALRRSLEEGR
jgi:O-succinylbenzoic acid--CoA ligase